MTAATSGPVTPAAGWVRSAVTGVLDELSGRCGIGDGLRAVDDDVVEEISAALAAVIADAANRHIREAKERAAETEALLARAERERARLAAAFGGTLSAQAPLNREGRRRLAAMGRGSGKGG